MDKMIMTSFFPLKKLRRNVKYLIFGAVLMIGVLAAYLEFVAPTNTWNRSIQLEAWNEANHPNRPTEERESAGAEGESRPWESHFTPRPWSPEYRGQANLHIFEDWCGGSTLQLRKSLHFPLYPHTRTTVKKLAVSPRWTNYGLRIFGYLHPYVDGEYLFAVASDDNAEFWLSEDDSPMGLQLLALVGKTGTEWTAPGEFGKYASQTSTPVQLTPKKRYYFEILHKQNDKGTDHVEVVWRLNRDGQRFVVIDSQHISLYFNETGLMMNEVDHIPQSPASHVGPAKHDPGTPNLEMDLLREDPRDSLYQLPLVDRAILRHVLPDCSYKPSYIIKGFPLLRYQGLQFVHMSYVYPNDYTRLTHMETDNKCFYHENLHYLERFGFFRYMKMDTSEKEGFADKDRFWNKQDLGLQENISIDEMFQYENPEAKGPKQQVAKEETRQKSSNLPDYGDDYDDYAFKRKRKLFSLTPAAKLVPVKRRKRRGKARAQDPRAGLEPLPDMGQRPETVTLTDVRNGENPNKEEKSSTLKRSKLSRPNLLHRERNSSGPAAAEKGKGWGVIRMPRTERHLVAGTQKGKAGQQNGVKAQAFPTELRHTATPPPFQDVKGTMRALPVPQSNRSRSRSRGRVTAPQPKVEEAAAAKSPRWRVVESRHGLHGNEVDVRPETEVLGNAVRNHLDPVIKSVQMAEEAGMDPLGAGQSEGLDPLGAGQSEAGDGGNRLWALDGDSEGYRDGEGAYEVTHAPVFDQAVNWEQTFEVEPLDFHTLRSDWIDLSCNISGNLLLDKADALTVVDTFMSKLTQRNPGRFSLLRVLNVEKRSDGSQGSRYLLELELQEVGVGPVRLSHYVYALQRRRSPRAPRMAPPPQEPLLCTPMGFSWAPDATVHFIVPVKNQARWVQQFITDMEELYRNTGDKNFNVIITDYSSTDMDVERALITSALPRYQYLRLNGNFERSAGLQAGIDLITDEHSIVFLCDLHIHFPPSIIDSVRKHCVEGRMAFAPIVMRLNCGATPLEPRGFWEVNGFGLLGIYKSDLDTAGGMNTRDFKDRWGGEDWELLDRILQAGLEVERVHLRNFMHHYHSKRGMWNRRSLKPT